MSAHIQLNGVTKRFGAVEAIGGMSLAIAHNEFVTVVGSSGCGKTTLLSIVAGLTAPTGGEVLVDGVSLGKRAWGPRRFLAKDLAAGEHVLEMRVTNTLGGILRRFYNAGAAPVSEIPPCGLLSAVKVIVP